jgi:hypothetical protein
MFLYCELSCTRCNVNELRYLSLTNVLRAAEDVLRAKGQHELDNATLCFKLQVVTIAQCADVELMTACVALGRVLPKKPVDLPITPTVIDLDILHGENCNYEERQGESS